MATHDYVIANGTGAAVRSDLNGALAAIVSNNSSATEPGTMYAYQWWPDTTTGLLKQRNSANSAWITIGTLASANLGLLSLAGGTMTGVLAVTAGTAALPGIAMSGDPNTGIYSPGADQLAISTGGSGRLFVDASGRVGIGTLSPSNTAGFNQQLQLSGNLPCISIDNTGTGANKYSLGVNGVGALGIWDNTASAFRMYINSSGYVGIGTTSPSTVLDVNTGSGNSQLRISNGTSVGYIGIDSGYAGIDYYSQSGGHRFRVGASFTEVARIDSSGRLLVGTSSASGSALLQVAGDAQVQSLNGGPIAGTRNRVINGDMRIDQRNAGASVTPNNSYTFDRWQGQNSQTSKYTVQQTTTSASFFTKALLVTSSSAYSVVSSDYFFLNQPVEAFNTDDLAYGTASAKTTTLSFWVRSSLTGTFGGSVRNNATNRSYPFSYTISSADTYEYKTITIPGDTSGTWVAGTNGIGLYLVFCFGAGSSFLSTANAWAAGNFVGPTGQTSVVGTSGATFYITGVQLEPGTVATPFERRIYGQELALCQRYFEASGGSQTLAIAASTRLPAYFAVAKRATPTVTYAFAAGTNTVTIDSATTSGFRLNNSAGGSTALPCDYTWTASIEL